MGRRPVQNKKTPSDYPQIAFRVSKEDKKRLMSLIEKTQKYLNSKRKENDPFINKNDVVVRALNKGLQILNKK